MAIWADDRHIHNVERVLATENASKLLAKCWQCRFVFNRPRPLDFGICTTCRHKIRKRVACFIGWRGQDLLEGIYQKIRRPPRNPVGPVDFQPMVAIQLVVRKPKRRRIDSVEDMTTKVLTAAKNTLNPNGETDVKRVAAHLGWTPRRKAHKCLEALQQQGYLAPAGEMLKFTQKGTMMLSDLQALDVRG
jgi:hypothetical protein